MVKQGIIAAAILTLWGVGAAYGYEAVDVKNGAVLKGVVVFKGTVPAEEPVIVAKNQEVCGKEQKLGKYLVKDSRVKNAVVWIEDVGKGKALSRTPVNITLKGCKAEPLVSAGFVGGKFVFSNEDDIMHTLQLKLGVEYQAKLSGRPVEDGATIYNLAFPIKGLRIEKPIKNYYRYSEDTGYIRVKSNTHETIRGSIFIFDHPYAAVTDDQGSFTMDGLLPGEYVLTAWHEGFTTQKQHLTVTSGGAAHVEIELK